MVWLAAYTCASDHREAIQRLEADPQWLEDIRPALAGQEDVPAHVLRLAPTARSRLTGAG